MLQMINNEVGTATFNDEISIVELLDNTISAFNKYDIETALSFHTDKIILMEPNTATLQGKDALRAHFTRMFGKWADEGLRASLSFTVFELEVIQHRAFARGKVFLEMIKAGKIIKSAAGKFLCLFEKQKDGSWLRSHIVSNTDGDVVEFG